MSKIQDALKRIRTEEQDVRSGKPKSSSSQAIAKLEPARVDSGETANDQRDGPVVTIDFDSLRRNGFLAPENVEWSFANQYRAIKRPIIDNMSGPRSEDLVFPNVVMVGSPLSGDGKTFNCVNLALSMSKEKDKSVLLVDADVAKPHISALFGVSDQPGLIELLSDESLEPESLILRTNVERLSLLAAGRQDDHAAELLASRRMAALVERFSLMYPDRITLFDSPPILVTNEACVLAGRVGQIVLVVSAGKTPQSALVEASNKLDENTPVSVILNRCKQGFGEIQYGYGYGAERSDLEVD
jgi:exopolysaccharide/PEP-CTERM locus tyrosine autokinase